MRIRDLYPESGRLLLTGGGKDFIERIGAEAAKQVVIGVLQGENIRSQTEPLTRRRVAQVSGAMIALFARGHAEVEDFSQRLSELALEQIEASRSSDNASIWPAQWLVGLTGKSVQNVLRSDAEARERYLADFEVAITEAADKCRAEFGDIRISLGFVEDQEGRRRELDWKAVTQLTTAIGSATLTIRGSDKSMYGKLFERLVLGSVLTLLGFERVEKETNTRREKVFWLSDSSSARECDATVLIKPGLVARFDIGFIGKGNPEIMKDKLSRFASHVELYGESHASKTFIIVEPDARYPENTRGSRPSPSGNRSNEHEVLAQRTGLAPRRTIELLASSCKHDRSSGARLYCFGFILRANSEFSRHCKAHRTRGGCFFAGRRKRDGSL